MTQSSAAGQALEALGARLREIRLEAGLSGRDLGRATGWHSSKVSKIEHGRQSPTRGDIAAWCASCGVPEVAADLIESLRAVEGMVVEWRRIERAGLKHPNESINRLWERTANFRVYSGWVVPGPVQTPAYIRAVLESIARRRQLVDDVEETTRVRVQRQQVLSYGDRTCAIVVEESVLRNRIGGPETMIGQLGHLIAISTLPTVSLGVIPADVDRTAWWPAEAFWIFGDEQVAVELVSCYLTVTHPREMKLYAQAFAELAKLAVYGTQARRLITAAIDAVSG